MNNLQWIKKCKRIIKGENMKEIKTQVVNLSTVITYFASGYNLKGKNINVLEYYVDVAKGKVIFHLEITDEDEETC